MNDDLPLVWGSLASDGKRTTNAPFGLIGVMAMACMEDGECGNTGSPVSGGHTKLEPREGQSGLAGWRTGL